jgi:hypothetical protein
VLRGDGGRGVREEIGTACATGERRAPSAVPATARRSQNDAAVVAFLKRAVRAASSPSEQKVGTDVAISGRNEREAG